MKNGVFTENFVRVDTDDGVGGVMLLKRRTGDQIDLLDQTSELKVTTKGEAKELIELIQSGINNL